MELDTLLCIVLHANYLSRNNDLNLPTKRCTPTCMPNLHPQPTVAPPLPLIDTAIVDSGSSGVYLAKGYLYTNINPYSPIICVGTFTGQVQQSAAACTLALPQLPTGMFREKS